MDLCLLVIIRANTRYYTELSTLFRDPQLTVLTLLRYFLPNPPLFSPLSSVTNMFFQAPLVCVCSLVK